MIMEPSLLREMQPAFHLLHYDTTGSLQCLEPLEKNFAAAAARQGEGEGKEKSTPLLLPLLPQLPALAFPLSCFFWACAHPIFTEFQPHGSTFDSLAAKRSSLERYRMPPYLRNSAWVTAVTRQVDTHSHYVSCYVYWGLTKKTQQRRQRAGQGIPRICA